MAVWAENGRFVKRPYKGMRRPIRKLSVITLVFCSRLRFAEYKCEKFQCFCELEIHRQITSITDTFRQDAEFVCRGDSWIARQQYRQYRQYRQYHRYRRFGTRRYRKYRQCRICLQKMCCPVLLTQLTVVQPWYIPVIPQKRPTYAVFYMYHTPIHPFLKL